MSTADERERIIRAGREKCPAKRSDRILQTQNQGELMSENKTRSCRDYWIARKGRPAAGSNSRRVERFLASFASLEPKLRVLRQGGGKIASADMSGLALSPRGPCPRSDPSAASPRGGLRLRSLSDYRRRRHWLPHPAVSQPATPSEPREVNLALRSKSAEPGPGNSGQRKARGRRFAPASRSRSNASLPA
jgi:hypothetical protein